MRYSAVPSTRGARTPALRGHARPRGWPRGSGADGQRVGVAAAQRTELADVPVADLAAQQQVEARRGEGVAQPARLAVPGDARIGSRSPVRVPRRSQDDLPHFIQMADSAMEI